MLSACRLRPLLRLRCHRMRSRTIKALEGQFEERARELELAKSRLLAASHDLRQPLHALGLFVAQLRGSAEGAERLRLVDQIDTAVSALNDRFSRMFDLAGFDTRSLDPNDADDGTPLSAPTRRSVDPVGGETIVVIDDDPLVLEGTCGLLRSWGYTVVTADSAAALADLANQRRQPDLIISDLRLLQGTTGVEAIGALREACGRDIPAFLISGDTSPEAMHEARSSGYHLVHKPVDAMTLRAIVNRMSKRKNVTDDHR